MNSVATLAPETQLPLPAITIVRGPDAEQAPVLYVSWEQEPRFRPRPEVEAAMIVTGKSGESVGFGTLLCLILDDLFIAWRDADREDPLAYGNFAIGSAERAVGELKYAYVKFIATTSEAMLIARATELYLNAVRSVDQILDALIAYQRQPESTTAEITRRVAVLDRSLAGMVALQLNDKGADLGKKYKKHNAGEVTVGIVAQMLRLTPDEVERKEKQLLSKMREEMRAAKVLDEEELD